MTTQSPHPQNGNGNSAPEDTAVPMRSDSVPPRPEAGMGWKLTIAVVILAAALSAGFLIVHHRRASEERALIAQTRQTIAEPISVDAVYAKLAPTSRPLPPLPGETRGWYQSVIYARVNGYVDHWNADIGDKVHKGQVLATIATPDLDAQLQASLEQLSVAKSGIAVAQANAAFAKTTYERWHDSPAGVVAPQETDEKKAAYDSSVAELQAAQAKVSAAAADVDRIRAMESYKQVTAPFDGVITLRRIDIGNLVTAGSTTNTSPLYDIAQTNVIRVFTDVPQSVSSQIKIGMAGQMMANNFPGRVFEGKVARTSDAIDQATRTLKVEVDIPNPGQLLMPGMFVQVAFEVQRRGLVEVPASAMVFSPSGPQVAVVNQNGVVQFHNVNISVDNGNTVDIDSGVVAGERVALNVSSQITNGEHVSASIPNQTAPVTRGTASVAKLRERHKQKTIN